MKNRFEIVIFGLLPPEWSSVFDGMTVIGQPDGNTLIIGGITDQAALYGLLMNLRDWGLTLISVNPVESEGNETHE